MSIYTYINDIHLSVGENRRMNCPSCNGYKTFSITNNMGTLLWNCYKASCNLSGSKRIHLSVDDIKSSLQLVKQLEEEFTMPEYVVYHNGRPEIKSFALEYGIDFERIPLYYDIKEKRIVFPIKYNGVIVDAIGRSTTFRLPKWKRYGKNNLPFSFGCGSVAVVVEDCISASVVGNDVFVGVAVLGTSLSEEHKKYLSQFSTAIIALDPDAMPKTLAFAKELRGHVKDVRVLKIKDDLKYRNEEDFNNLHNLTPKENQHGIITN
tara:strand:- start:1656 stop:2447 length:792 start_codon:yes stop_codon:yes gene_type:complete